MIKLANIIKEIKISRPVPNNLKQLEQIKTQINQTKDKATKAALIIKTAELILPIWEHYYPNDNRPRKAIEASKAGNHNVMDITAYDAATAAFYTDNAAAKAAAAAIYNATYYLVYDTTYDGMVAINNAINATKLHFNIKEIKIQRPFLYKKAYGESHSYNEYKENANKLQELPDSFLINVKNNKIIASFTGYNVARWASKIYRDDRQDTYKLVSRSVITNPPPYLNIQHIDIDNSNSWEQPGVALSLAKQHQPND